MSDDVVPYRSCLTCGCFIPLQVASKQVYCSPECAQENRRCPVCGGYFEANSGILVSDDVLVCSEDCAQSDERYDPLFKETS